MISWADILDISIINKIAISYVLEDIFLRFLFISSRIFITFIILITFTFVWRFTWIIFTPFSFFWFFTRSTLISFLNVLFLFLDTYLLFAILIVLLLFFLLFILVFLFLLVSLVAYTQVFAFGLVLIFCNILMAAPANRNWLVRLLTFLFFFVYIALVLVHCEILFHCLFEKLGLNEVIRLTYRWSMRAAEYNRLAFHFFSVRIYKTFYCFADYRSW